MDESQAVKFTEIHPIRFHPETNLHKKRHYLSSPGVWPSEFSFEPPTPPTPALFLSPKRHFCNSEQASELCQKVLASLKADPLFKAVANAMGSTFPSAGTRNGTFFTCVSEGPFYGQTSSEETVYLLCKEQGPSGCMGWENSAGSFSPDSSVIFFFLFKDPPQTHKNTYLFWSKPSVN